MSIGLAYPWALALLIPTGLVAILCISRLSRESPWPRWYLAASILSLTLISIAAAQPFLQTESNAVEHQRVDVFIDKSTSMHVFDNRSLPEDGVRRTIIARNESSPIASNIIANLREKSHAVLDTDGWRTTGRSMGELQSLAREYNTTLYLLQRNKTVQEGAVTIEGPEKAYPQKQTPYKINVHGDVPASAQLTVTVNNTTTYSGEATDIEIRPSFTAGHHAIKATLDYNDAYERNNHFSKTVQVIEQPRILYIGERTAPLAQLLHQLYEVRTVTPSEALPNLEPYYSVVMNNLDAPPQDREALRSFITDNNGLLVAGGRDAYDSEYKGTFTELLPVSLTGLEEDKEQSLIVLAIDISGSTGTAVDTGNGKAIVDMEKGLALSIINSLDDRNRVGAIAFNDESHLVATPQLLSGNRQTLTEKISRLEHQGGTEITQALYGARQLINDKQGDVILISDGKTHEAKDRQDAIQAANVLRQNGITVHTVSVGEGSEHTFLQKVAQNGNGYFFQPEEHHKFSVVFSQTDEQDSDGRSSLVALNTDHFITQDLDLSSSVGSYNDVKPKQLATKLITTANNRPVLTVWRYGVGRVAALTGYDGNTLGNILEEDSDMVIKTVNWLAGDPLRKQDTYVDVSDSRVNAPVTVTVKQDNLSDPRFSEIEEGLFQYTFTANTTGIHQFMNVPYAINYQQEYERFGYNPEIRKLVQNTGGETITTQDLNNLQQLVESRKKTMSVRQPLEAWCIVAAIIVFLIAIALRKLLENTGDP